MYHKTQQISTFFIINLAIAAFLVTYFCMFFDFIDKIFRVLTLRSHIFVAYNKASFLNFTTVFLCLNTS